MLKVGIFGVGHLGKFHISNWKEIAGAEIVGFYDPNDETAAAVAEKFGINSNASDSDYWKNKYLNLLEKYNLLLESKLN